jgi:AbrB family looped-hinge helix DNA binding protein
MHHSTKLSTKGQVVLPKSLRTAHRWRPGTEFIIQDSEEAVVLKPKRNAMAGGWEALLGCVAYRGRRKSLEEMDLAIERAARARK